MVHHHDLVAHLHRLQLIMGDIDRGRPHPVMQGAQLFGHMLAELGIQRAKRFVHEERLRVAHNRPTQRHALPITARQAANGLFQDVADA